jgi:hypothetical protein
MESERMQNSINLNIQTLDNKRFSISVVRNCNVGTLKETIAGTDTLTHMHFPFINLCIYYVHPSLYNHKETQGVEILRQRLIFHGKVLKNDKNIDFYSIDEGHTVSVGP